LFPKVHPTFRSAVLSLLLCTAVAEAQYNFDAILSSARKEISKNNFVEAIRKLNICLDTNPGNAEAYFYRGACKYSLYDNIGAEEDFTSALTNGGPYYYDALLYRSKVRYRLSDYSGAINDLNDVIKKQQLNPNLYVERAFAKLAANEFNGAISDCQKAIALKATGEDVYLCKAAAEDALENYTQAISDYDKAVKINGKNENAYVRRGNTRYKAEDYCGAIEDYNKALVIDTACTLAYFSRAEAEVKIDSSAAALRDYNIVLNYEPRNSYAYFNRGVLYSNLGKTKNAIADFDKVLLLNPENIQALSNRAKLKQNIKDLKGAMNDYNRIIELYPYFMEAYYNRAQIKYNLKDAAGAKKDFETGKMMSEMFHSKTSSQLTHDSTVVAGLLHLSADFNRTPKSELDTLNIQFQPLFYITEKSGDEGTRGYADYSLLYKLDRSGNKTFCFSNNELSPGDRSSSGEGAADTVWSEIISMTNNFRLNDASEGINKIIQKDTSNAIAYFQRAIITCREIELMSIAGQPAMFLDTSQKNNGHEINKKRMSAIDDFSMALKLEPSFSFAYFNRGNLKCMLNDFNGALKDYEATIKAKPDFAEAYFNMGFVMYYMNYKNVACNKFSKAGELGISSAYTFIRKYCDDISK